MSKVTMQACDGCYRGIGKENPVRFRQTFVSLDGKVINEGEFDTGACARKWSINIDQDEKSVANTAKGKK